jgi:hypothetical protein
MGKRRFDGKKPVDKKANDITGANGKEIEIQRRHTVDYRQVNNRTQPKAERMPYIEDAVKNLAGSTVYGKFDQVKSFWQLPLAQKSWDILSHMTDKDIFTPKRVMQGHCDSALFSEIRWSDACKTFSTSAFKFVSTICCYLLKTSTTICSTWTMYSRR